MKLHKVTILVASEDDPETPKSYAWEYGGKLEDLERAIAFLAGYARREEEKRQSALTASHPLDALPDPS